MSLFCPKCGSILLPKKGGQAAKCGCGYTSSDANVRITEKLEQDQKVEIIEKKENILPTTSAECPKCGNNTARYWLIQTRASDEPETKFLQCTRCEHTWRDYS
ncbi:transcription factor S [Candidatus Woesearchaeota archaeon]|nr:transcription factor S [Candidatus Woesearchaeota archaeon]